MLAALFGSLSNSTLDPVSPNGDYCIYYPLELSYILANDFGQQLFTDL